MYNLITAPADPSKLFAPVLRKHLPARYAIEAQRAPRYVPVEFCQSWVIWDRVRGRVADGFYAEWVDLVPLCDYYNANPDEGDRDWLGGTWWSGQPSCEW
ncbi:MAG TPA: hypothetical protein VF832_09065 [Longimicrobiales bacterium]